jgi:hypothetical protein
MKLSTIIRWSGPAAIAGGVFMVFSELSSLPIHVPYLSRDAPTGYDAVGSGLILFALVLLLVGMLGLYAGRAESGGPRVLESGTGYLRREDLEVVEEDAALEELRRLAAERGVPLSRRGSAGHGVSTVPLASSGRHSE